MVRYNKGEAREWARENMRGLANVVIPSYTLDLKRLNEKGIRHDIRKEIEYGFWGTLLVSEVAITVDEYRQFIQWAHDEAGGRLALNFFNPGILILAHWLTAKPGTLESLGSRIDASQRRTEIDERVGALQAVLAVGERRDRLGQQSQAALAAFDQPGSAKGDADRSSSPEPAGDRHLLADQPARLGFVAESEVHLGRV